MNVPFIDLKAHHQPIREELRAALDEVIQTSQFAGGEPVRRFERDFAAYVGLAHCVGCASGTAALHLALLALGVGEGDEVLVPVNTFIATAEAVSHCGARPVFVDMDPRDYDMDVRGMEAAITPRTRAVIPVHLYGQPAEMDAILTVARRHGLKVVEDCAQAHDAEYKGRKVGTFGEAAAFSFYPTKNLGACGDAGAVLVNDEALARRIHMYREHGSPKKYQHDFVGYNYRMDGFQGAVLGVKLKHLRAWTDRRRGIAARYAERLSGLPVVIRPPKPHVRHVYHLFVIEADRRDGLMSALTARGVGAAIHYPVPLHLTGAYAALGYAKGAFPAAEACADRLVSLPMYAELTDEMVDHVCGCVKEYVGA